MKKLLMGVVGMVVILFVWLGTAFAHGPGAMRPPSGRTVTLNAGKTAELVIVHVVNGCHSWTDSARLADRAKVTMRRGGQLTILNQDVDRHRIVQLAGPKVATGSRMTMNATTRLTFGKSGVYRFKTVTSDMPGMTDMKTVGADYQLVLVVRVK